jgi:predicted lipid-binding transport protein (Tim44 family)
MKRRLLILGLVAALVLILAPEALAAAGGGSSGFGGGGGEGGGGRGVGLYILIQILIRIAFLGHGIGALVLIGLIVLAVLFFRVVPAGQAFWSARRNSGPAARRQVARRQRRAELAAAEAAEEDPQFAPDAVRAAAAELFTAVEQAWDGQDRERLSQLVTPALMNEWNRRLGDFEQRGWRNHVQPLEPPTVEYVSLVHRGDANDRVVVRIEGRLRDFVVDRSGRHVKRIGHATETIRIREYWTLARNRTPGGRPWILASIEQGGEGRHALDERLLATRASDEQGMRDEALVEGAVAEAVPSGVKIAEVADLQFVGDARAAALDLSLADGRFAPDILDVAARRAVAAWAQAIDGDDAALDLIADRAAVQELLHPGDPSGQSRLVVRGPQVARIRIVGLDAATVPPTMTIEVDVRGRRYLEDRDTAALVAGNRTRPTSFTERWTMALTDDPAQPWRIRSVGAQAAAL